MLGSDVKELASSYHDKDANVCYRATEATSTVTSTTPAKQRGLGSGLLISPKP